MVDYDRGAIEVDMEAGMNDDDIMKKHNITFNQFKNIRYAWKKRTGRIKPKKDKAPSAGSGAPIPAHEPPEPRKPLKIAPGGPTGDYFDITGQVLSRMRAVIVVEDGKGRKISTMAPLFGVGLIPLVVYAKAQKGDKIWVNDRKITGAILAGFDMQSYDAYSMLTIDKPKSVTITKLDDTVYSGKETGAVDIIRAIRDGGHPFPEFTNISKDDERYGEIKKKDVNKYVKFFEDKVYGWKSSADKTTGSWEEVRNGKKVLTSYGEFLGEIHNYHAHMLFMDYLDRIATKKVAAIAEDVEKSMVKTMGSDRLIDPRPNPTAGVTDDTVSSISDTFVADVKALSPVAGLTSEDVKIWLYYKFYLERGVFKVIGQFRKHTKKKHKITDHTTDENLPWLFNMNIYNSWFHYFVSALCQGGYDLTETGILKECKNWLAEAEAMGSLKS